MYTFSLYVNISWLIIVVRYRECKVEVMLTLFFVLFLRYIKILVTIYLVLSFLSVSPGWETLLICKCSKLAQLEYKKRYNKVAGAVHWSLCEICHIKRSEQWYQHTAEPVIETQSVKILWDMNIHVIKHRWPDILVIDKNYKRALLLIDIAVPADAGVEEKEQKKMDRHQDMARELKRLWKVETKVIPIVVEALGTVAKGLEKNLKKAGSNALLNCFKKLHSWEHREYWEVY